MVVTDTKPCPPLAEPIILLALQAAYVVEIELGTFDTDVVVVVTVVVVVVVVVSVAELVVVSVIVASASVLVPIVVAVAVIVLVDVIIGAVTVVGWAFLVVVPKMTFSTNSLQATFCGYRKAGGSESFPPFFGRISVFPFLAFLPRALRLGSSNRKARGT